MILPRRNEFELRYAGEDCDTAADVLTDIDFDYLLLWGHYRLMIEAGMNGCRARFKAKP